MTRRPRILAALIGAAMLTTVVAGCTGDAEPEPTATPTAEAQDPGVTDIVDAPGSGEDLTGALADSEVATCEQADGGWSIAGTVTNPTDAPVDYRIYVSLLNGANDTRGLQQVDVSGVGPQETSEWESSIAIDEADLQCVLRVERYAAAG